MSAALAVAAWVALAPAPHLEWRTLKTPCCDVHFPAALESQARRVAGMVDGVLNNAVQLLDSTPSERVQVVVHDVTDSANGFSNSVPYDIADLRLVPPDSDSELASTDDYLRMLLQHELLHVVHLDTIHGIPWVINLVLGKSWPPNIIQPRFIVEGLATYAETRFTTGGRLRSTMFLSPLRIAAEKNDLWSLDDVSNGSRRSPGGTAPYVYGGAFVDYLVRHHGEHIWAAIAHDYGGDLIPYAVQRTIERETGVSMEVSWARFLEELRADAALFHQRVTARGGPTAQRRLTRLGASVRNLAFVDDDTVLLGLDPPNGTAGIYRLEGARGGVPTLVPVLRTNNAPDVVWADGQLFFTQAELVDGWRSFHDVWRANGDGSIARVTHGARVFDPAWLPGTRELIAEQRTGSSDALVRVHLDTGAIRTVVDHQDGARDYTPAASPDGKTVVVSRWSPGGARDLVLVDLRTLSERWLTRDDAEDHDPGFSADGRRVLFVSDREGVLSLYAVDVETLEVRRVVDSLGLVQRPMATPDGRAVLFVDTDLDGQDVYAAAFDWQTAPLAPSAGPAPAAVPEAPPATQDSEPYNPLWTLVPHNWLPLFTSDTLGGPALGAVVSGEDAAGLYALGAQATWGFGVGRPRVSAALRMQELFVPLTFAFEWRTDVNQSQRTVDGEPEPQQDTVLRGGATASIPLLRKWRSSHTLGIGVQRELHVVETPFSSPPDARAPTYPPKRALTALTLDWGYSSLEGGRDAVATENGTTSSVHYRHADPVWGSEHEITELTLDVRTFEPVWGLPQHSIGAYASGGVAFGNPQVRSRYALGGFTDRDLVRDLVDGNRSGVGVLRGYPRSAAIGDAFVMGTLEYRLPLWDIERGVGSLPLFLNRIALAPFCDLGLAFDGTPNPSALKGSIGAELRVVATLGYYGTFLLRAGYARGVSRGGIDQPYVVMGIPY